MSKFIFVTGGVISSLGKGIASASIGKILESRGLKIAIMKLDPYINVDPGTMNPYQHGEVYVTEDGAETDLDLGHYERFTNSPVSKANSITTGQIYNWVISRERRGDYLGDTIQVIPHITDAIKAKIVECSQVTRADVVIVEVGGTVGDIESLPFLEAARQFRVDMGHDNVLYIHLTLLPFIEAAGEVKTKPTQHSVGTLREIGIIPDVLICRTEKPLLNDSVREKISLFCNVKKEAVIESPDMRSIYQIPLVFKKQILDEIILSHFKLICKFSDLKDWERDVVSRVLEPHHRVSIAVVGKYIELQDAYKSIYEALYHAGIHNDTKVEIKKIDSESLEKCDGKKLLQEVSGILVPGGFGYRGIEGKIKAIKYARENGIPFLGLCLGMQCAVIEFARNVCGLNQANSTEFKRTKHPVISLLEEQETVDDLGGTMRLGAYPCRIKSKTLASKVYGRNDIKERHRHRYEFNNKYRQAMSAKGLVFSGVYPKKNLVEVVEIKKHPYFIAVQFHPEFKSKPDKPHPLFREFIRNALEHCGRKVEYSCGEK